MAPHVANFAEARATGWLNAILAMPSFSGTGGSPVAMSTAVKVSKWLFLCDDGTVDGDGNPQLAATASGTDSGAWGMYCGRIDGTTPGPPVLDWQLLFDVNDLPSGFTHFTDHWHIVVADPSTGEMFHWLSVALSTNSSSASSTGLAIYKYNTAFELQPDFPVLVNDIDIPDDFNLGGKTTTGDHFICEAPNGVVVGIFNMARSVDIPEATLRLLFRDALGQPDIAIDPDGYIDLDLAVGGRAISNGSSATYRAGEKSPFRLLTHDSLASGVQSAIYRMNIDETGTIHRDVILQESEDSSSGVFSAWAMASEDYLPSGRVMAARLHTAATEAELRSGSTTDEGAIVVELFYGGTSVETQQITAAGNRPHVLCVGSRVYVSYDTDTERECYLWWDDVEPPFHAPFAGAFPIWR